METKQHRSSISREVLTGLGFLFILTAPLQAQFTTDYQTNIISGVTSNWTGSYIVGSNTVFDALQVLNLGLLNCQSASVGYESSASNNIALIKGSANWFVNGPLLVGNSGSGNLVIVTNSWSRATDVILGNNDGANGNVFQLIGGGVGDDWTVLWANRVYVGYSGADNQFVVSHGGNAGTPFGGSMGEMQIGVQASASNNLVTVTGDRSSNLHSALILSNDLYVGNNGSGNRLLVSDQGTVSCQGLYLGNTITAANNTVTVTDTGSVLTVATSLSVGNNGSGNQLILTNGGTVSANAVVVGVNASASSNTVIVTDPGSALTASVSLVVGNSGSANRLTVANGGQLLAGAVTLGVNASASNNTFTVNGPGSFLSLSNSTVVVGSSGVANGLIVTNGVTMSCGLVVLGDSSSASNNWAVVTGSHTYLGTSNLRIGSGGANSQFLIADGGQVDVSTKVVLGELAFGPGSPGAINSTVTVSGTGSVLNASTLNIGGGGRFGSLTPGPGGSKLLVMDGGRVMIGSGNIGYQSQASNNMVIVNGSGSVFTVLNELDIGRAGVGGKLLITNGGSTVASSVIVGVNATSVSNVLNNCGGSLIVTNALATGTLDLRRGTLVLNNGGNLTVDQLLLNSGSSGVMAFLGGSLNTKGSSITNGQVFVVGDGTDAATFRLQGGMHSFANGLEISNNATLTGCGTISGNVLIDMGGQVTVDCGGGLLTFTGTVTNNGTIRAINGSAFEAYGTVVNNGVIDIIDGGTNFHSAFINNGIVLDANSDSDGDGMSNLEEVIAGTDPTNSASVFRITGIAPEGDDMRVTWTMGAGRTNALQVATDGTGDFSTNNFSDIFTVTNTIGNVTNYLDTGGATNAPARFYRVRLVP